MYPDQLDPEESQGSLVFKKLLRLMRELLETIVPAVLIAFLINIFMAQATRVYGQSMEPNLHTDQRLVVEKLTYNRYIRQYLKLKGPARGDVVVIRPPNQPEELLIKRVIGLPGDEIEIHDGQVFVNGEALGEPYINHATGGMYGPVTIPPLHIFVLGDNRNFSNDSRNFGAVPLAEVIGRAWFSYWPVNQIGFVH